MNEPAAVGRVRGLERFLAESAGDAGQAVWLAAIAVIEHAAHEAKTNEARWRYHPHGEVRRFRRNLARGLLLARLAVALQEEENDRLRDLQTRLPATAAPGGEAGAT